MYLGVEKAVRGTSIGVVNRLDQAIAYKRSEIASPGLMPEEILLETEELTKDKGAVLDRVANLTPRYEAVSTAAVNNIDEDDDIESRYSSYKNHCQY